MALRIDEKLVLASQSPSRRMLLEQAGVDIEVIVSGADETVPEEYTPAETVECLAERKAAAVEKFCPQRAIIAADSVVSIDGMIIGKPEDDVAAKATLSAGTEGSMATATRLCAEASGREREGNEWT